MFAAGYIAGVFCAIVSHPADTVVSKLNQEKGASAMDVAKKLGFMGKFGDTISFTELNDSKLEFLANSIFPNLL